MREEEEATVNQQPLDLGLELQQSREFSSSCSAIFGSFRESEIGVVVVVVEL